MLAEVVEQYSCEFLRLGLQNGLMGILYDLEAHEVRETLRFPEGVRVNFFDILVVSPDGLSLFVIGSEIYELSTATHELVNQISWSKARASGYGGVESAVLSE